MCATILEHCNMKLALSLYTLAFLTSLACADVPPFELTEAPVQLNASSSSELFNSTGLRSDSSASPSVGHVTVWRPPSFRRPASVSSCYTIQFQRPSGSVQQQLTINATGCYRIEASGAWGGNNTSSGKLGGKGALAKGNFSLTLDTTLSILVGQAGAEPNDHYGGAGGAAAAASCSSTAARSSSCPAVNGTDATNRVPASRASITAEVDSKATHGGCGSGWNGKAVLVRRGNYDGERGGWIFDSTGGSGGAGGTSNGGGSGAGTGGFGGGGGGGCGGGGNKCDSACSGPCRAAGGGGGGYSGRRSRRQRRSSWRWRRLLLLRCRLLQRHRRLGELGESTRTDNRWDPWDPVVQARILPLGTRHWSQMKAQATANCPSTSKKDTSVQSALPENEKQQKSAVAMDGLRIRRSPHTGSPSWLAKLNTGYNQRARQGFVYWFTGRPKPTQFGRYSTGAKHMQYGLAWRQRS
uniref:receptor protein-tyrosine kinase n=1 Tax=Macrostomum lignano TaxID=282301 RepID=A0A1I8FG26_9PLAT